MFKKLKKSVIDKNKILSTNLNKRVNKTPSKIVFPNRANLTFANIIVNMSTTPSRSTLDNWNNSYFTTELYNNSFISKSKNNINKNKNNSKSKDNHSKLLSIIINGIINLKSNDLLGYSTKLIEIMAYIRDNIDTNNNYIDIQSETNKDLLILIYKRYFQIYQNDSIIYLLLKNDLQNGIKLLRKVHIMYILYILTGIIYFYNNLKPEKIENKNFFNFLKQFIKNEKCNDFKCAICNQIDKIEKNLINNNFQNQNIYSRKPSVVGKYTKKNNIINSSNINNFSKLYQVKQKAKYNIINNSNDNIIKNNKNSQSHNKDKSFNKNIKIKIDNSCYSHIVTERNNKKVLNIKRCKNKIYDNKKKTYYTQIMKASEKEKNIFFNDSYSVKEKNNSKNKLQIQMTEKNILDNSYNICNYNENNNNEYIDNDKRFLTERNDNRNIRKIKIGEFSNLIEEIKVKLYKNNKSIKTSRNNNDNKNKIIDKIENYNNNYNNISSIKKTIEINKKDKGIAPKNKKIKINISTELKNKNDNSINMHNVEREREREIDRNKEYIEINNNLNKSSKVIKENINAIEQEIKNFKEHNNYIKQKFYYLMKNYKDY